jgi:hypothetical protein
MRRTTAGLGLLAAALLGLAGCKSDPYLKPPKAPEVYAVPPADDARFAGPPKFPPGTLNQDNIHKNREIDTPAAFGAGGGPGGVGVGGGARPY